MAEQYYIRWKSVVSGPYTDEAVREMIRDGKVSKHHQVSSDQVTWTPVHGADAFSANCRVKVNKARLATIRVGAAIGSTETSTPGNSGEAPDPQQPQQDETGPVPRAKRVLKIRENVGPTLVEDRWYYVDNGASEGPVSMTEIRALVDSGIVGADSPICREGEERWLKASEAFPGFWNRRHAYVSPPETRWGATNQTACERFGGFWLRFFALFIDSFLVLILQFAVGFAVGFVMAETGSEVDEATATVIGFVVGALVGWIYFAAGESGHSQGTVGKRAMSLAVTDLNGDRITFGRASGRYFSKILSGLFFGIGYLMVAFSDKKQGLHDMMAGTLVVRR